MRKVHKAPDPAEWRKHIPAADDTRRPKQAINKCGCRSHLGRLKTAFKSEQSAMQYATDHSLPYGGTVRAYKCPKSTRWHLTTKED